jgi:ketosteroid isomerase-like protein
MLKKILLPSLAATVTLATPLSSFAASTTVEVRPVSIPGLSAKKTSLSAADERAIRKMIADMLQGVNAGDTKKYLRAYSTKYKGTVPGSETVQTYENLQQGANMIGLIKAMGVKMSAENINILSTKGNAALVELVYRADVKDNQGQQRSNSTPTLMTVEKINGRWLIVEEQTSKDPSRGVAVVPTSENPPANTGTAADQQAFSLFFTRHLDTLNKKDLNGYLATLDPEAPLYKQAKVDTAELFREYTLKYSIKSVKVLSIGSKEAVVQMVATVKKISGGDFKDSKMTTTNVMRKTNGKWRIYDTEVNALDVLAKK